jgi:4,5-dihydroxyphthalate decarboxylase
VFTSRFFRHSCVFVNRHKGINSPADLKGKIIGLPEYQITAVVWLKGIFEDEYGVGLEEVHWRNGGEEAPGRTEKIGLDLPQGIDLQPIGPDQYLSQMLDQGDIDALFTARVPSCFERGSPNVARLFADSRAEEVSYYKKTGIFPIMHLIIIKRQIYEQNPWIAVNLCKAFEKAKEQVMAGYRQTAALFTTLPWMHQEMESTQAVLGQDWWPYGLEANRKVLETFLRYHHRQGLSKRLVSVEELFAPETLDQQFII